MTPFLSMLGGDTVMDFASSRRHEDPKEVRLHLGVHKTASTHLQDTLLVLRSRLAREGLDALPVDELRRLGFPRNLPRGSARKRGRLSRLRRGSAHLLISEERWLSGIPGALAPDPYPDPGRELAEILPLLKNARLHLFVAIRDMGTHLPSSYAEALRFFPETADFEDLLSARKSAGASWIPPLRRLRAVFPDASLTVWRYEDYRTHTRAVIAALCGIDPGPLPQIEVPRATRSPTAENVTEARALVRRTLDRKDYLQQVRSCLDGGREGARYTPLTQTDRAFFSNRYAEDLSAIAAMDDITFLSFD